MSDEEDRPRKRFRKAPAHECTVILIDVGANMKTEVSGSSSDMELAKDAVEWIITRKVWS